MNLFILTKSDGNPITDKTVAAVTSISDTTVIEDLGNLVLGDYEPLVIKFTDGTTAPAFAGNTDYTLSVSIGSLSVDGSLNFASTTTFTPITAGWSGTIALTSSQLIAAVQSIAGGPFNNIMASANVGGNFGLQIRVSNASAYSVTYALLQVFIEWRVVSISIPAAANSALTTGPTRTAQTSISAGDVTVTPGSQFHTERITFTGTGTRNIIVASLGLVAGAHVDLSIIVSSATNGLLIKVYAVSTSGTELVQFTKSGGDTNAFFALRADGAGGFNNVEQLVPAYTDA